MVEYISAEKDVDGGVDHLDRLWKAWNNELSLDSFNSVEQWSSSVQVSRVIELLAKEITVD